MKQVPLFPKRGGKRPGAGRKRLHDDGMGPLLPHLTRPEHKPNHPVHVTMRAVRKIPSLRQEFLFRGIRRIFARASRDGFRLVQFSVQRDHLHLIVEAGDKKKLARGVQWLSSMIARAVNLSAQRSGKLWRERYHRHDLKTPREVRNALVYVLFNFRKHAPDDVREPGQCLDPRSSAAWFDGWETRAGPWLKNLVVERREPVPIVAAESWLGRVGWRRSGLVRVGERPRA